MDRGIVVAPAWRVKITLLIRAASCHSWPKSASICVHPRLKLRVLCASAMNSSAGQKTGQGQQGDRDRCNCDMTPKSELLARGRDPTLHATPLVEEYGFPRHDSGVRWHRERLNRDGAIKPGRGRF